jgi:DhnA family fructose-bisphosphate aldolase class Ia
MTSQRRLGRILGPDGRTIILALDAPPFFTDIAGVDTTVAAVPSMVPHGLNAVLVPRGIALKRVDPLQPAGLVVRADASNNLYDDALPGSFILNSALDAIQAGADGVVTMTFPGAADHPQLAREVEQLRRDCEAYQLPLIIESLPYTFKGTADPSHADPKVVAAAVRWAAEAGADLVKTRYSGRPEDELIAATATVPVVALGGPKTGLEGYLEFVRHCLDAGAVGVACGRNIIQDPHPVAKVAALGALIHQDLGPDAALALYHEVAGE